MSAKEGFNGPIAFHPIIRSRSDEVPVGGEQPYGIAVVEQYGSSGYREYQGLTFETREAAKAAADEMNTRLGLTPREAALIVADNMGNDVATRRVGRGRR